MSQTSEALFLSDKIDQLEENMKDELQAFAKGFSEQLRDTNSKVEQLKNDVESMKENIESITNNINIIATALGFVVNSKGKIHITT